MTVSSFESWQLTLRRVASRLVRGVKLCLQVTQDQTWYVHCGYPLSGHTITFVMLTSFVIKLVSERHSLVDNTLRVLAIADAADFIKVLLSRHQTKTPSKCRESTTTSDLK